MVMNYRAGAEGDVEAVAKVNISTWQTCFRGLIPQTFLDNMQIPPRAASFARRFSKPGYGLIVAEDSQSGIVGFCDFGPPRDSKWSQNIEIYAIYVEPSFHRQGIGRDLFKLAAAEIVASGQHSLFVRVLAVNPFRDFYAKCGGRVIDSEIQIIEGESFEHLIYAWDDL